MDTEPVFTSVVCRLLGKWITSDLPRFLLPYSVLICCRRMKQRTGNSRTRRKALMLGTAALAGAAVGARFAAGQNTRRAKAAAPGEYLIRGGQVVSVDPAIGTLPRGDVHLRDGSIVSVGPDISARGATVIDASNSIVMPGFVETHWHMWNSIWRGMAKDASEYFRLQGLSSVYTPEDHYIAVMYAAIEAINSGITTCHNWAHGVLRYEDAEAEMRALVDSGLRARMGYVGVTPSGPTSETDLRRALAWIDSNGQGRLSLSLLLDGAGEHFAKQVELGRILGLKTITDHGGFMAHPELLGPEFLFTHGTDLRPDQIVLIAKLGIKVGLCPTTDPMIGAGLPPIYPLLAGGVPLDNISFTLDVTAQTPADPFASLRTLINAGRIQQINNTNLLAIARANTDWKFSYQNAIRLGTMGGANVLGIANQVGSLTPGKRADVIVVRKNEINMLPAPDTDPVMQMIQHGEPSNVDTVFIDGRLRKRAGKLVGIDVAKIVASAATAQAGLRARSEHK